MTLLLGGTKNHTAVVFCYRRVYNNEDDTVLSYAKWQSQNRNTLSLEGSKSTCKLKKSHKIEFWERIKIFSSADIVSYCVNVKFCFIQ